MAAPHFCSEPSCVRTTERGTPALSEEARLPESHFYRQTSLPSVRTRPDRFLLGKGESMMVCPLSLARETGRPDGVKPPVKSGAPGDSSFTLNDQMVNSASDCSGGTLPVLGWHRFCCPYD